jgi:hypothetical protein
VDRELFEQICHDVQDRSTWANRQPLWYRLRREGARRNNKPYPKASDKHFPLMDIAIRKLKPVFSNQIFAQSNLADFLSKDPRDTADMSEIAWWFDYKLKEESNFEEEMELVAEYSFLYGRSLMKCLWNEDDKHIEFCAIEPLYVIVPDSTKDLMTAPYLVHVQHLSKWEYKHGPNSDLYDRKDDSFLRRICGSGQGIEQGDEELLLGAQKLCDGVTHSSDDDTIILWEVYERENKEKTTIHTVSPLLPYEDIREPFELPYKVKKHPFVDFPFEKMGKSYYSARGIAELGAGFQSYLAKTWNGKSDAIDLWNNPPLSAQKDVPITQNIRVQPGSIIPFPVAPLSLGVTPIDWDQEMANTRNLAEQIFAVPDFGIGGGEKGFDNQKKKPERTATETQYIASITNMVLDARSQTWRRSLFKLYRLAWEILKEKDNDPAYLRSSTFAELPDGVQEKVRSLRPSGSAGQWNRTARLQNAIRRKMMFQGSPFVKQEELDKMALELDEAGLVERLYQDPGIEQQEQTSEQMMEIPALLEGMPVATNEKDDPFLHAGVILQFLTNNATQGRQVSPEAQQSMIAHLNAHVEKARQINPKQINKMLADFQKISDHINQQQAATAAAQGMSPQLPPGPERVMP